MFGIGDIVVYANSGVCEVKDIATPRSRAIEKGVLYYFLKPLYSEGIIYCPVDNPKVFIRPVISKQEAQRLIDMIPTISAEAYHNRSTQLLSEHYGEAINSHNCVDLIELVMSIYQKKQALSEQKRKLGQVDERFMKRAQELLYGELAVALEIDKSEVESYIAACVEKAETEELKRA